MGGGWERGKEERRQQGCQVGHVMATFFSLERLLSSLGGGHDICHQKYAHVLFVEKREVINGVCDKNLATPGMGVKRFSLLFLVGGRGGKSLADG